MAVSVAMLYRFVKLACRSFSLPYSARSTLAEIKPSTRPSDSFATNTPRLSIDSNRVSSVSRGYSYSTPLCSPHSRAFPRHRSRRFLSSASFPSFPASRRSGRVSSRRYQTPLASFPFLGFLPSVSFRSFTASRRHQTDSAERVLIEERYQHDQTESARIIRRIARTRRWR